MHNNVNQLPDAGGVADGDLFTLSREGRWRKISAQQLGEGINALPGQFIGADAISQWQSAGDNPPSARSPDPSSLPLRISGLFTDAITITPSGNGQRVDATGAIFASAKVEMAAFLNTGWTGGIFTGAGDYAFKFGGGAQQAFVTGAFIRDRTAAFLLDDGSAYHRLTNITTDQCGTAVDLRRTQGIIIANVSFQNASGYGMKILSGGELKLNSAFVQGSARGAIFICGSRRRNVGETYFTDVSATVTLARSIPILSVADNGSGLARFTTSLTHTLTGVSDAGVRLRYGGSEGLSDGLPYNTFRIDGTGTLAVLVNGFTILASTAYSGTPSAIATQVANAINAGSTGFVATTGGPRVTLTGPLSSQWQEITFSGTLPLLLENRCAMLTFAGPHDFAVENLNGFGDLEIGGTTDYNGVAEILAIPSANTVGVELDYTTSQTGTAWTPQRLCLALTDLRLAAGAYTATGAPVAIGPTWFDTAATYVGNATGVATTVGWDYIIDAKDTCAATNDIQITGGNANKVLIKSGYAVHFTGSRGAGAKTQLEIDYRAKPQLRAANIGRVGHNRGRTANGFTPIPVTGTNTGYAEAGTADDEGVTTPGGSYAFLRAPNKATALVNREPVYNSVRATEAGIQFAMQGVAYGWTGPTWNMPGGTRVRGSGSNPVNGFDLIGQPAGVGPSIRTIGVDANIPMDFVPKGTGSIKLSSATVQLIIDATLKTISAGAADSGGAGFKLLRVPN